MRMSRIRRAYRLWLRHTPIFFYFCVAMPTAYAPHVPPMRQTRIRRHFFYFCGAYCRRQKRRARAYRR